MNDVRRSSSGILFAVLVLLLVTSGCEDTAQDDERSTSTATDSAVESTPAEPGARGGSAGELDPSTVALRRLGTWNSPLQVVGVPGTDRIAVVEQEGRIRLEDPASGDGGSGRVLLDVSSSISTGGERGLLGLAFHSRWPDDDRIFVDYTDVDGDTRIVEYHLSGVDATARRPRELLHVEQPYENHNGGALAMSGSQLFIGMGDGGSGGDPEDRAQQPDELLGKVLRIDVDAGLRSGRPYEIPRGNPYADGDGGAPEVWATGLRNPWRFSIDRRTGLLWIGDVGQDTREEVDAIPIEQAGANLGWDVREGTAPHGDAGPKGDGAFVEPIFDYGRGDGCSVTGGFVYRGSRVPALVGRYVFADLCSDQLWALDSEAVSKTGIVTGDLDAMRLKGVDQPSSFGVDDAGELYVTSIGGGVFALDEGAG